MGEIDESDSLTDIIVKIRGGIHITCSLGTVSVQDVGCGLVRIRIQMMNWRMREMCTAS